MSPLDWVSTAMTSVPKTMNDAWQTVGLSQAVQKEELKPGDHVYAWRLGYAFNHHGVVVRTIPCGPNCRHDTLDCCSIVHFNPPEGERKGRIELTSLAAFGDGWEVNRVRYGVHEAEFYLRRAGVCTVETADAAPLSVLRALSLLEASPTEGSVSPEAAVEYDLFTKNCELLARWCQLGDASGVHRFRSDETATSLQSAPGRFVRLGLAVVVPVAVAAAAAATTVAITSAAGAASTAVGAGAGAAAVGEAAGAAAAVGSGGHLAAAGVGVATAGAATGAVSAVGGGTATAGTVAVATGVLARAGTSASTLGTLAANAGHLIAREAIESLVMDAISRPSRAAEVASQIGGHLPQLGDVASQLGAVMPQVAGRLPLPQGAGFRELVDAPADEERRYRETQGAAVVRAFRDCLADMRVTVSKQTEPLLGSPASCCRLCEVLVDILEVEKPAYASGCAAVVRAFVNDMTG